MAKTSLIDCSHCGGRVHQQSMECPWCGHTLSSVAAPKPRRKWSIGALITVTTLVAIFLWLASLTEAE